MRLRFHYIRPQYLPFLYVLSLSEFEVCLAGEKRPAVSLEEMKASHYTLVIVFPTYSSPRVYAVVCD